MRILPHYVRDRTSHLTHRLGDTARGHGLGYRFGFGRNCYIGVGRNMASGGRWPQ